MRSFKLRVVIPFVALALGVGAWSACKQEEGERCQIDDDCVDDLVCNKATLVCAQLGGGGAIDADVPLDAPDAPTIDAPDAPPDAPDAPDVR